jgi:acyl-CoA reductase-like NAD-dependent aldehyde dehydrogenase
VAKVSFTGSTEVGRTIMRGAADTIKRVTLELGGKSPNIIFPDADVKAAVRGAYWGIFLNSGQACQAGSRLLVHQDFHDAFMEELLNLTRTSRLGDPLDEKTMLGPLVDQGQMNTVLEYIQSGRQEGAVLLHGGERVTEGEFGRGCYVQPTIFDAVQPEMTIAREEIFGPVLSVMTFRDVADAVRLANQTCYGLAGAVWTRDLNTALQVAKGVRAGTVWVNAYYDAGIPFSMPMGGYRQSGIGRELGREGLLEYLETKSIQIKLHVA